MLPGQKYTPEDIGRILWRGKWLILLPLLAAAGITAAVLRYLPDAYRAETTILVVPQRVPDSYVRATVTARIGDRLQSISQQLLSRSRLEPILMEFDLYQDMRRTKPMEDVVLYMRRQIEVQTLRGDTFVLRFSSPSPETAQRVTERLASLFIEENLRDREVLADATNQFLESQLEDARRRLIANEKRLEEFRVRYSGELPTQAQSNLQAMQNLQMQVQSVNDALSRDRDRRLLIERSLSDLEDVPRTEPGATVATVPERPVPTSLDEPPAGSAGQQLAQMLTVLEGLRSRLTPQHPDVVRAERIVKDLEVKAAQEAQETAAATAAARLQGTPIAAPTAAQRRVAGLRGELTQVSRDIATRERQLAGLETNIGSYRGRLEAAPARESEMTELMRDYDTIRRVYTDLLAKREESKVAANLERRQIGEQFRVLDPARTPIRPFSPDRPRIAIIGLLIGLAIGISLVALREATNHTLRSEAHVAQALGLPVLAMVPRMRNAAERRKRLRVVLGASAAGVAVCAAAGAVAWRWLM